MGSIYELGKIIIALGVLMVIIGSLFMLLGKVPGLGRMPGDIFVQKGNFTFYFPIVSMIILSLILTLILNIVFKR